MWNHKANRIADLEARLAVALRKREHDDTSESATAMEIHRLRAELRRTRNALRTTEDQLAAGRRENAERARRQVAYSNQAVANLRRLKRALHACARYRAELAEQQRTTAWLGEQLLNSTGFDGVEPQPKQVAP